MSRLYESQALLSQIRFTSGRMVPAERLRFLGDRDTFTLSAQIQPGNSGGPVLNRKGEVVGVVVARISDAAVAKATGTIPQNVNFAITRQNLLDFLGEALGPVALSAGSSADLDDGIPRELQDAVIPIVCEAR